MSMDDEHKLVIVMVGARHVGKTIFLASLAHTAQISSGDPSTIKLLKLHWNELTKGSVPSATAGVFTNLQFTYRGQIEGQLYNLEFRIPDYDGHFAEIISDYESGDKGLDELRAIFEEANGFIIFMPADEDDAKTIEALNFEIGHFIHLVRLCFKEQNKIDVPLVIAVNKWDKSQAFKSEQEDEKAYDFIRSINIYASLLATLENYFSDIKIIPFSAYGHSTDTDRPKPGAISPWRVIEPVEYIIRKYFSTLNNKLDIWRKNKQWAKMAQALLETRDSWKRSDQSAFYQTVLQEALEHCFDILASKLSQQQSATDWSRMFESLPEGKYIQYFSQEQRNKLAQNRKNALAVSYESLLEKLSASKNTKDYDNILNNDPESGFYNELSLDQRHRLEAERIKHARSERKLKNRKLLKYIFLAGVIFFFCFGIFKYLQIEREFAKAMNEQQPAQSQWRNLSKFVSSYEGIPVISRLFSTKLKLAAEKHSEVLNKTWLSLEQEIDSASAIANPCARKKSFEKLKANIGEDGLNLPTNITHKYQTRLEIADSWCKAWQMAQNVSSAKDAEEVNDILSVLGNSGDPEPVKKILAEKINDVELAKVNAAREKKQLAERKDMDNILVLYKKIRSGSDFEKAQNFINEYGHEANPEIEKMVSHISGSMGERFYAALLSLAEKADNPEALQAMANLLGRNAGKYSISEPGQKTLGKILQNKLQDIDRALIESLDARINSAMHLADMQSIVRKIAEVANTKYETLAFQYHRPTELVSLLSKKMARIENYENMVQSGIKVENFSVLAESDNALNLHGRRWSSGFTKNKDILIRFPEGIEEKSVNDPDFRDFEQGDVYHLDFGPLKLKETNGEVVLKTGENTCSSRFRVTANELLELANSGIWRYRLQGNCNGLNFIFKK